MPLPLAALRCVALFACVALWGAAEDAQAQDAVVRGFVRDASDGQALQGVNVVLTGTGEVFYGAATDADGLYAVRVPPGRYVLQATYIGYQARVDTLDLEAAEVRIYSFDLAFGSEALGEVLIEEERETSGAASVTAGLQTVQARDIELVPAPDVSGDLAAYLGTLPGVVSQGDQGGQLFIRGGEPTQNLVLVDGMLLYQPFHLLGFYSAFPSDIVNVADVYAGGFGARYGGRLSSVIDITTRTGNKRRFAGAVSAAPFVSAARLEGPLVPGKVSFLLSGRVSVIEEGAARLIDEPLPFTFDDQFAKVHADLSAGSRASVSAIRTYDRGVLGGEAVAGEAEDDNQVVWRNTAVGARYLLLPTTIPVSAEVLLSYSSIENEFGPAARPSRASAAEQYNVAANLTHYAGFANVNWGLYVRTSALESRLGGLFQNVAAEREFITEAGVYLEPELTPTEALSIQPGLRVQAFPSKGRTFLEPRLRVVWDVGAHRLSAAAGIYHQEIVGLSDRRDAGDVFTAWTSSPLGSVPQAWHGIAGYQVRPLEGLKLNLEGFYKALHDLYVAEWTAFPRFTTQLQPAGGRAYGADARVELAQGPFYGFINYGYSKVSYDAQQASIQYWFGTRAQRYAPPHDRRHQVNALASLELFETVLNVRWQFGSGLPFSEAVGFDEFVLLNGPTDVRRQPGLTRVLYGAPYEGRLPSYHRLDVSLEREQPFSSHLRVTFQVGVTNSYDRANLFYIDLFTLQRLNQLPLIPSFGLKVEFD